MVKIHDKNIENSIKIEQDPILRIKLHVKIIFNIGNNFLSDF